MHVGSEIVCVPSDWEEIEEETNKENIEKKVKFTKKRRKR
jgi:hypothetical protein